MLGLFVRVEMGEVAATAGVWADLRRPYFMLNKMAGDILRISLVNIYSFKTK